MPFGWIGHTVRLAARDGYDVRLELADAGVGDVEGLLEDGSAVGPAAFLLMCALVINAVDDEMHGASNGRMARGTANLMIQAAAAAQNLAAAIETVERFFVVAGTRCRIELQQVEAEAKLLFRSESGDLRAQQVVEEMLATFLNILISFYLGFLPPLSRFATTARSHPLLGRAHPFFLCPVVGDTATALHFPAAYLGFSPKPKVLSAPLLEGEMSWLSLHADAVQCRFSGADRDSLSASLFRSLVERDRSLDECCRQMLLSEAALRRGLYLEGTSFRTIRRAALVERVRPHLSAGMSADDLAAALGYSDARSLRRALHLATGLSLTELRQNSRFTPGAGPPKVLARLCEEVRRQA